MTNTNTPSTAAPKYIKRYRLSFFYESYANDEGQYIAIEDPHGGVETVVQAATVCRLDLLMTNGDWERRIGISLTSSDDQFKKAHGRQVALLRAVDALKRDERAMVLQNWFREHPGVHGARRGDPKKFWRLATCACLSDKTRAFMQAPFPVEEMAAK